MSETERQFPILVPYRHPHEPGQTEEVGSIPWRVIAPHWKTAKRNHGQTLERLAERGGLAASEAVAVIEDRAWHRMDRSEAIARLRVLVAEAGDDLSPYAPFFDAEIQGEQTMTAVAVQDSKTNTMHMRMHREGAGHYRTVTIEGTDVGLPSSRFVLNLEQGPSDPAQRRPEAGQTLTVGSMAEALDTASAFILGRKTLPL